MTVIRLPGPRRLKRIGRFRALRLFAFPLQKAELWEVTEDRASVPLDRVNRTGPLYGRERNHAEPRDWRRKRCCTTSSTSLSP